MRVLHINSYYGGSLFYRNLYDIQVEQGLDIDVFVPTATSYGGIDNFGHYTKISRNHFKRDRLLFHLKHNKICKDIVSQYNISEYSIIHAHSLFSNGFIALYLKKRYGIPYIVAVRNTDINVFFKYMLHMRNIGIQILKEADRIVFLSESYRDKALEKYIPDQLKENLVKKINIIPNGIEGFWLDNLGEAKRLPAKNDIRLLYVGVINKNKNITVTVRAMELLMKRGVHTKLTVVGKIADRSIYKQLIQTPNVTYIEPKPKEELISIYRENDIFIMPSKTETFGLVYAEAMSQGLPVIYTAGQGFDGQFEEGEVGYHSDCSDPNEIADRIVDVLDNYEALSHNCITLCKKFEWTLIAKQYEIIYKARK